ncbi:MAG: type II toxin-antitoxin system HicB family antitoxin [Alphaproteobacteria bacterium]|nr:type II toxin-antitoxin system HicB family antitoxin [Alphaproteobacteria bacterium]
MMEYKGYLGKAEYDDEAELFHGEVIGTNDIITFQGASVKELKKAFKDSVDEYIDFCRKMGKEPEKTASGKYACQEKRRESELLADIGSEQRS